MHVAIIFCCGRMPIDFSSTSNFIYLTNPFVSLILRAIDFLFADDQLCVWPDKM